MHMRNVHNQTNAVRDASLQSSSRPPSGQKRKRGDGDEVTGGVEDESQGAGLQALERENQKLRDEIEILRCEREAEAQRHREVEAEKARELVACREMQAKLVRMLDRALSKDGS